MKRTRMFLSIVLLGVFSQVSSQEWIGERFHLDSVCFLPSMDDLSHVVVSMVDSRLVYAEATAFREEGQEYTATFHTVDLDRYSMTEFQLSLPFDKLSSHKVMAVPWIYDFDLAGDSCLVSIQNQLLLYRLEEGNYKLMSVFQCENAKVCYLHRGDIYFMEEDHDVGYRWYRLHEGKRLFVRALDYEAPHVVQAKPNRYLFRDNHHVYFLSNRYPSLSLYSLEGVAQDTVVFDLPCWHPFEDEYVKASLEVPYGVERIKATMKDIYRYSYLKMVFPIGGDYLIYYTQYDTVTHESKLRFAIGTPEGQTTLLSQKPTDEYVYDDTLTPFTLLERHVDKAFCSWNDRLVEMLWMDTVSPYGKTDAAYRQAREDCFRNSTPQLAVKVSAYQHAQPIYWPAFYNVQFMSQSLADLPAGKYIMLLHGELECSSCRKALLSWLNGLKNQDAHLVIVCPGVLGGSALFEWRENIRNTLKKPFQMLFLNKERYGQYPHFSGDAGRSFPGILLYEVGRSPIYLTPEDIFSDDIYSFQFRESFLEKVEQFLANP